MPRTKNTQAPLMSPTLAEDKVAEDEIGSSVGNAVGINVGLKAGPDVGTGIGTGVVGSLVGENEGLRVRTCCVTEATERSLTPSASLAAASKELPVRDEWTSLEYSSDDAKLVVESGAATDIATVQV